jgi:hypothetical protein
MEIKINAKDLLEILLNNNILEVDAKAIIYDLLVSPQGRAATAAQARPAQPTMRPNRPPPQRAAVVPTAPVHSQEEEPQEEELTAEETETRTPNRRRNVNFRAFGGPAEGLK